MSTTGNKNTTKHAGGSLLDSVQALSEPTAYIPLLQKRATGGNDVL